ncbi:hypothetical protein DYB30_004155 [Aphanomyces astaci]|uniref:Transmembrane protein n=1 Tax=Aphanomyces astaci TaxID=112090 RepID=A0A397DDL3_APHAT|nr:hypothetical protein DYB30_004155 [Aphanomyces astaci]
MSGINEPSRHVRFFQLSTPRNNNDDDDVECTQESVERRRRWKLQAIPLVIFFMLFLSVLVPFVTTNKTIEALRFVDRKNSSGTGYSPNMLVSLSGMSTDNYGTLYLMKLDIQAVTGTAQFNGGNFSAIDNFEFVVLWPDDFSWTYTVRPTISADFPDATVAGGGTLSDPTTGYTALTVEITRDFNIYMALVFVGIWAVTIAIGYIGSRAVIWKTRAPDNPVIFVSALFAVPTFRNTTPGRPPYGCLFDVLCTYFSIAVIVTFLVLVAFAYMKKPNADKKKQRRRREDDDTIPVGTLDAGVTGEVAADVGDVAGGAGGDSSDATTADSA